MALQEGRSCRRWSPRRRPRPARTRRLPRRACRGRGGPPRLARATPGPGRPVRPGRGPGRGEVRRGVRVVPVQEGHHPSLPRRRRPQARPARAPVPRAVLPQDGGPVGPGDLRRAVCAVPGDDEDPLHGVRGRSERTAPMDPASFRPAPPGPLGRVVRRGSIRARLNCKPRRGRGVPFTGPLALSRRMLTLPRPPGCAMPQSGPGGVSP